MSQPNDPAISDNPFSTRRVRPGAIPFIFPAGLGAETLLDRLRQAGWWGEIVGQHGSGKSALLASLISAIERTGPPTVVIELHDRQRRLPVDLHHDPQFCPPPELLIVDGYEQLSRWNRWRLIRFCRRHGMGLLVTTHKSLGLPELYRTVATPELAKQVVAELMGGQASPFSPAEVAYHIARHRGDLRETLFDLYDIYEERRPSSGQNVT